jgi:hypothetical protein
MRETCKRHNLIAIGLILALAIIAPSSSLTLPRGQDATVTKYYLAQYCVPNDDDGSSTGTIYC